MWTIYFKCFLVKHFSLTRHWADIEPKKKKKMWQTNRGKKIVKNGAMTVGRKCAEGRSSLHSFRSTHMIPLLSTEQVRMTRASGGPGGWPAVNCGKHTGIPRVSETQQILSRAPRRTGKHDYVLPCIWIRHCTSLERTLFREHWLGNVELKGRSWKPTKGLEFSSPWKQVQNTWLKNETLPWN
jgi:hypothetical protein